MKKTENPKFRQILETARSLFMRFGIRRVSVEEICREANVSKMTFYKFFKNKNELVRYIFDQIALEALSRYNGIMAQDVRYSEKAKQIIQMKLDQAEVMSTEFIRDFLHSTDSEIAAWYQQLVQERMQLFLQHFKEAQEKGDIRSDVKPEFILYIINRMIEMVDDDRLVQLYDTPKELTHEVMNFLFYGILQDR
jgi:AcrR family transcriptional regulator